MMFSNQYLATILLLASSLAVCYCRFSPVDYLVVQPQMTDNEAEFDWLCKKIEEGGDKEPEEVLAFLKDAEVSAAGISRGQMDQSQDTTGVFKNNPGLEINMLWKTISLLIAGATEPAEERKCRRQAGTWLSFLAASTGGLEELQRTISSGSSPQNHRNLFNFLKHYGAEKYEACVELFDSDISDRDYNVQSQCFIASEGDFDNVFTYGDSTHMSHEQIYPMVQNLDLVKGRYPAKRMEKAAKERKRYPMDRSGSDSEDFFRFLEEACENYQRGGLTATFDVYNLARLLVGDSLRVSPSTRWLKLNEYVRICSGFSPTKSKYDLLSNIKENGSKMSKLFGRN